VLTANLACHDETNEGMTDCKSTADIFQNSYLLQISAVELFDKQWTIVD
jgi:hypothetical protein